MKILTGLTEKYKDVVAYRFELARSYSALGQLAATPNEAARLYSQSRALLEDVVKRNPDNAQYRRALEELQALSKPNP